MNLILISQCILYHIELDNPIWKIILSHVLRAYKVRVLISLDDIPLDKDIPFLDRIAMRRGHIVCVTTAALTFLVLSSRNNCFVPRTMDIAETWTGRTFIKKLYNCTFKLINIAHAAKLIFSELIHFLKTLTFCIFGGKPTSMDRGKLQPVEQE